MTLCTNLGPLLATGATCEPLNNKPSRESRAPTTQPSSPCASRRDGDHAMQAAEAASGPRCCARRRGRRTPGRPAERAPPHCSPQRPWGRRRRARGPPLPLLAKCLRRNGRAANAAVTPSRMLPAGASARLGIGIACPASLLSCQCIPSLPVALLLRSGSIDDLLLRPPQCIRRPAWHKEQIIIRNMARPRLGAHALHTYKYQSTTADTLYYLCRWLNRPTVQKRASR